MLRSMFSAVAGLRAHQTMMDVTANNVANVNTAGYKSSRTTFQEALTQMTRGGAAGGAAAGGVNPQQLGLGSQVAATDGVFTQGAPQATGRATDVAIQGDGMFVVDVGGEQRLTRAGAFSIDNAGNLVGPAGERVMAENGDAEPVAPITIDTAAYTDIAIGSDGTITGRDANGDEQELGQMAMARVANPGGLEHVGGGLYAMTGAAGAAVYGTAGEDGLGGLQAGSLEMSNVDLALEFTNLITAQRGYQANSRTITTSDEMLQELMNLKR